MTKKELIGKMSEDAGISKQNAEKAFNSLIEGITESLKNGEEVRIIGFGTFAVKERAAREGRNPSTGEPLQIPATKVPRFTPGKNLKEEVK